MSLSHPLQAFIIRWRVALILISITLTSFSIWGIVAYLSNTTAYETNERLPNGATAVISMPATRLWLPGDCQTVTWAFEGIAGLYVNRGRGQEGQVGSGELYHCFQPLEPIFFSVLLPDETQYTYFVNVEFAFLSLSLWGLLILSALGIAALYPLINLRWMSGDFTPISLAIMLFVILIFVGWASAFIFASSYVSQMDGTRYFFLLDDAMISMRYAWNLTHSNGLVWSVGEQVEGYTNFLWVMLMALIHVLIPVQRFAVLAVQILGGVLVLVAAYLSSRLVDHQVQHNRPLAVGLAFVAVLAYYPLVFWSVMGMEVGFFAVLILAMANLMLGYERKKQPSRLIWIAVFGVLLALTRPEGLVLASVILAYGWWGSQNKTPVYLTMVAFIVGVGSYFLFR
jgi:hypothetical protein